MSIEFDVQVTNALDNPERLLRLRNTSLLDSAAEEAFDRLTRLAARLLKAPLSTVTLVDDERQFYLSCTGMPEPLATDRQTPLEFSFCRHTVVLGKPLIIPDVREHPMVSDNPAIEMFGVTAYAGIPLLTVDGYGLGTLCVMDFKVRDWTAEEVSSLTDLAAAVSTEIELRLDIIERIRAEDALKAEVKLREEVLGVVSHDLRNPVHTISLASSLLLTLLENAPADVTTTRKHLEIIGRAARQMDHLIGDLLDVASISSDHLAIDIQPEAAGNLVRTACESLRTLVEEAGLELNCDIEADDMEVLADADRFLQLVSNLVGNAIKFTAKGGRILLASRPTDQSVTFSVSDSGSGISPDELPHIFDQFWQAGKGGRGGAGLGLAISRGIASAHGGRIWAESVVGTGTTFYFDLTRA